MAGKLAEKMVINFRLNHARIIHRVNIKYELTNDRVLLIYIVMIKTDINNLQCRRDNRL